MKPPRNVVILSNLPLDLHDWLKEEAARQTKKGNKVAMCHVVEQAIRRYKESLDAGDASYHNHADAQRLPQEVPSGAA